jgi:hypothetical protein
MQVVRSVGRVTEFCPRSVRLENAFGRSRDVSSAGILRLRSCFAERSSHSAQDDSVEKRTELMRSRGLPWIPEMHLRA